MYEPAHILIDTRHPFPGKGTKEPWCQLLHELFLFQIERNKHLHLLAHHGYFEQFPDQEVQQETLCAVHHLRDLAPQRIPKGNNHLNRQLYVHTTFREFHHGLDTRRKEPQPKGQHTAAPRVLSHANRFATTVARLVVKGAGSRLPIEELLVGEPDALSTLAQQVLKRQRLYGKQSPQQNPAPKEPSGRRFLSRYRIGFLRVVGCS